MVRSQGPHLHHAAALVSGLRGLGGPRAADPASRLALASRGVANDKYCWRKGQLQPRPLAVREGGVSRNWALMVMVTE